MKPICESPKGNILLQGLGFGLLAASVFCWIQDVGAEVGIPLALATIMLAGAPLPFLLAQARWRPVLHALLGLTLGAGALSVLSI